MIRVVIVDDHPVVLAGLAQILAAERDIDVVATCNTADAALAAVSTLKPDVLILDLRMPERDGVSVLAELTRRPERPRVVVLSALIDADDVRRVILLGVDGIVLKEAAPTLLLETVRRVAGGERCLDAPDVQRILKRSDTAMDPTTGGLLSGREVEIAWKTAQGIAPSEIATSLGITDGALAVHLERIRRKLGDDFVEKNEAFFAFDEPEVGLEPEAAEVPFEARRLQKRFGFTPREAVVAALLAEGLSNKEIGARLKISLNTVKTHIAAVHAKADVTSTRRLLVLLRSE